MKRKTMFLAAMALSVVAVAANAGIVSVNLGTAAPPIAVGPYFLTPFSQVTQALVPDGTVVSTVTGGPGASTLGIAPNAEKTTVGVGWATWSNGYTGAVYVYDTADGTLSTTSTITLPASSHAFYLYAEPQQFGSFNITVTPSVGAPVSVNVVGNSGANGYAFYTTANETLTKVTVTTADPTGMAIGEFALYNGAAQFVDIPALEPGMLATLAVLLLGAGIWMQRRRKA